MSIIHRMFETMDIMGLKSVDLAVLLNINPSVISTWKSRNKNPPSEYICCICKFLGVSVEWLLTGEGAKLPKHIGEKTSSIWELQDYQRQAANEHYGNLTDEQVTLLDNYEKLTLPNRRELQGIIQLKLVNQSENQLEGYVKDGTA